MEILSPPTNTSQALANELAIAAMRRALKHLRPRALADIDCRARAYLAAGIPIADMARFDLAALKVERIRRAACPALCAEPISEVA